jgi:polysaccharide export outer membrane protein
MVPKAEHFYIYGEVKSPNMYPLKPDTTVMQALSLAGGLTDRGSDKRVEIRRRDEQGRMRPLPADLADVVKPDDILYVKERFF